MQFRMENEIFPSDPFRKASNSAPTSIRSPVWCLAGFPHHGAPACDAQPRAADKNRSAPPMAGHERVFAIIRARSLWPRTRRRYAEASPGMQAESYYENDTPLTTTITGPCPEASLHRPPYSSQAISPSIIVPIHSISIKRRYQSAAHSRQRKQPPTHTARLVAYDSR